jgi:hypothetical protein
MVNHLRGILRIAVCCIFLTACGGTKERPLQYIYLALGASDATGVGALPLMEGYVYLIARELDRQLHGVFLVNLGVPGRPETISTGIARAARHSERRYFAHDRRSQSTRFDDAPSLPNESKSVRHSGTHRGPSIA